MEFAPEGPVAIPMWINGHAFLTATQEFLDVVNPLTGQALRRVPLCGAAEAAEAVAAAQAAQPAWAAADRAAALVALADALDRYTGHFAKLLGQDTGVDEATAVAEVAAAVNALRAGDATCTGAVESKASDLDEVIAEVAAARQTERGTRADDKRSETAMEDRKKEGYF